MDLFRFTNPTSVTKMEQGVIVDNFDSLMWIERYRDAGEFTLVAKASTNIQAKLPRGSYISHIESDEIMIVENHELTEDWETEGIVTITGRSFETVLEDRSVGTNKTFPTTDIPGDVTLGAVPSWEQARIMVTRAIHPGGVVNASDGIPFLDVELGALPATGTEEERSMSPGPVYNAVIDILAVDELGIKTLRPTNLAPINMRMIIHKGVDRSVDVAFSFGTKEVNSADYLWSRKKTRNTAHVAGKWVQTMVTTGAFSSVNKRMMFVDASDLDDHFETNPTGSPRTIIVGLMNARGREALARTRDLALIKADITRNTPGAIFRKDYQVGDIVGVKGNFNENAKMRVSEYVEVQDENGFVGYPTLTSLEAEEEE